MMVECRGAGVLPAWHSYAETSLRRAKNEKKASQLDGIFDRGPGCAPRRRRSMRDEMRTWNSRALMTDPNMGERSMDSFWYAELRERREVFKGNCGRLVVDHEKTRTSGIGCSHTGVMALSALPRSHRPADGNRGADPGRKAGMRPAPLEMRLAGSPRTNASWRIASMHVTRTWRPRSFPK